MSIPIKTVLILVVLAGFSTPAKATNFPRSRYLRRSHTLQSSETTRRAEELFQEALSLADTKDRERAQDRLRNAMALWLQMSEPHKAALAAIQIGQVYKEARKYQYSLECYEQALDVHPLDSQTQVVVLNSIASVYIDVYQRDLAFSYYAQAIKLAKAIKDNRGESTGLAGFADLYYRDGDTRQSLSCIAQARRLAAGSLSKRDEAHLAWLAGQIHTDKQSLDRAQEAFDEARALYEDAGDEEGQVQVISSVSNLHLVGGRLQAAVQEANLAVDWAERLNTRASTNTEALKAREVRWRAWLSHARAHRAVGDKQIAVASFTRTIVNLEGLYWLVYVTTENSAVGLREKLQAPYRELADLLVEEGKVSEAFEWIEHAKSRAMLGIASARRTAEWRTTVDEKGSLRPLSQAIAQLRVQLGSLGLTAVKRASLEEKLNNARTAILMARSKLEMQRSRKRLVWFPPASVKDLQKRLEESDETIIEFALGTDRSFAWTLSSRGIALDILPGSKEIETQVRDFIELLGAAPANMYLERDLASVKEHGKALFSTLLGPLSDKIAPGKKLIIVPDGILHYLPFESLLSGDRYLIEDHEISYVSSASMLALWQDSKDGTEDAARMELLALGDPIFRTHIAKSNRKRGSPRSRVTKGTQVSLPFQLPPLPRTRDEVQVIAGLFPPSRVRLLLGSESTENVIKSEQLRRYRRIHFATHSLIDETSPSRSAVVLTLAGDSDEDGFLEVDEIADLDLDCDLVVLSACQTARGQLLSGEGILGLTRAFIFAGARSVVVSQWRVSDISTGQLMKSFYQNIVGNLGNAAALRSAKLQMLRSETETRHPYYWAAFILIGKP
jgi:CHAT domain-containing protein